MLQSIERALRTVASLGEVTPFSGTVPDSTYLLLVDASGAAVTVPLPAASGQKGRVLNIKKVDSSVNAVTIDANASETIDGALTQSLTAQWQSRTLVSDGTAWFTV